MLHTRYRTVFFLLFALSGFTGLIYESLWTHYLKLFLGHAAYAQTLVLAIFMGGLALGSWICSKYSSGWKNLLLLYALAEGAIGLFALFFHPVFRLAIDTSYTSVLPQLGSPLHANLFKWTLSAILILPETVLLGMTFPLMSAGILRAFPDTPGKSISLLYFTNSIGAATGVLVSGFILTKLVGLPGTMRIAGFTNLAIAGAVWFLIRGIPAVVTPVSEEKVQGRDGQGAGWYWFLLLASLVTGTASFIYEIGWIRMLSLVLGSSTHAFELMLSAFIFGLAFGGLWIQRRIDHIGDPIFFLVKVQLVMGVLAISTIFFYGHSFEPMQWIVKTLPKTDMGYAIFNLSSNAIALLIMVPTTFCAGMTLPLITYSLLKRGHGEKSIGSVYAANTVGAIIGIFSAVHLGMPMLGLKGLIISGASLDIILAISLLFALSRDPAQFRRAFIVTGAGICIIVFSMAFINLDPYKMASGVYRLGDLESPRNARLLYHKDGKTSTVSVFHNDVGFMSIRTNGKSDAMIQMNPSEVESPDEHTMILVAAIAMALEPHATTVANIGFGSGLTTNTLLLNESLERVDTVEIEPAIIEGARNFGDRVRLAYTDPRSRIHIDDAKTFFSVQNRKYDIIISEPSNPWVSGVASLFSEEFYRMVSRNLNDDGLFCQWLQIYEIDIELVASVLKALSSSFKDYVIYAASGYDLIIVATNSVTLPRPDPWLFENPRLKRALHHVRLGSVQDLEIRKVWNKKALDPLLGTFDIRVNSDFFPVLDQNAVRARFLLKNATEILKFTRWPLPAMEILTGSEFPWSRTNVTPAPHYIETSEAFDAMTIRDYVLDGNYSGGIANMKPEMQRLASDLRNIASGECGKSPQSPDLMSSLYNGVAVKMTPFLRPAEMERVWKALDSGGCLQTLKSHEREWVDFFKALGQRDTKAMVDIAEHLLAAPERMKPGPLKYFVAAGMLGSLNQGNPERAFHLWEQYKRDMFGENQPDLLFRLLVANSKRPKNGQ